MKARYFIALAIVLLSIAVTPYLVELAYIERGGVTAFGGEYMVIPFGIVLASGFLSVCADIDRARRRKAHGSAVYEVRPHPQEPALGGDENRENMCPVLECEPSV